MAVLRRQEGQAAVEFFFVMIGVVMILGLMAVLSSFAQDVFFENTRMRAETLKKFHAATQYKVGGDTPYRPDRELRVEIRKVPYLDKLVSGVPAYQRSMELLGGTAPLPFRFWGAAEECGVSAGLVASRTRTRGIKPGAAAGVGAGTTICLQIHGGEFR